MAFCTGPRQMGDTLWNADRHISATGCQQALSPSAFSEFTGAVSTVHINAEGQALVIHRCPVPEAPELKVLGVWCGEAGFWPVSRTPAHRLQRIVVPKRRACTNEEQLFNEGCWGGFINYQKKKSGKRPELCTNACVVTNLKILEAYQPIILPNITEPWRNLHPLGAKGILGKPLAGVSLIR